ncbi:MAG TPA: hypothetical protein VMT38_12515 [Terracidiphilus sp.]|nr:hypothetical protein [Terracidiphilus sp.]
MHHLNFWRSQRPSSRIRLAEFLVLAIVCVAPNIAWAQVQSAGDQGGLIVSAGAMGSGYYLQYGQQKIAGIAAIVDADTKRRFGIEAEGRWLEYHQTANVHAETYSIGARYHFDVDRCSPYAKGLVGFGDFNFPYNYAQGRYLVVTAGAGLDFHWTRRISIRAVDVEYQDWPNFTFGNMNSFGVNAGLRVRIF